MILDLRIISDYKQATLAYWCMFCEKNCKVQCHCYPSEHLQPKNVCEELGQLHITYVTAFNSYRE